MSRQSSRTRTRPMKSITQQVKKVSAAVEKFEKKIAPQATTTGPSSGIVVSKRMSRFLRGFLRQPPGVSAGRIGILSITFWRLASCCASSATSVTRIKSEGWKVIPMIGIRIQRDALFRFTPITNVSSMKPSARMNSTTVKRT